MVAGYESLNRLIDDIANSFISLQQNAVQYTLIDIDQDYHETTNLMQNAPAERK